MSRCCCQFCWCLLRRDWPSVLRFPWSNNYFTNGSKMIVDKRSSTRPRIAISNSNLITIACPATGFWHLCNFQRNLHLSKTRICWVTSSIWKHAHDNGPYLSFHCTVDFEGDDSAIVDELQKVLAVWFKPDAIHRSKLLRISMCTALIPNPVEWGRFAAGLLHCQTTISPTQTGWVYLMPNPNSPACVRSQIKVQTGTPGPAGWPY